MSRRGLRLVLALLVTAAALWLSFRNVDGAALQAAFRGLRPLWLVPAVVNSLLGVAIMGLRWAVLLRPKASIGQGPLFRTNILAQCVNILAPARLGEAVRVWGVSRDKRFPPAFVLGTIGVEKLFDVFLFIGLWAAVPAVLLSKRGALGYGAMGAAALIGAGGLALAVFRPALVRGPVRILLRLLPASFRARGERWTDEALEAFAPLKGARLFFRVVLLTFLVLFNQVLTNWLVFLALGMRLSWAAALMVLLAVQAGAIPPSTPGKLGIFEYAVILALAAFSVPRDAALACGILLHLVAYVPKLALGAVFAIRQRIPGSVLK